MTSPKVLLFYDQIEYLKIISTHSFWQVFSLGHFPIHPFFLPIFWIISQFTLPNYTAFIFGLISAILMFKICRKIFSGKYFWLPVVIFLFFPGVWLINTNLMVQSVLLTFYLLSVYLFLNKKIVLFSISVFLMMGIHIDSLYWITSIFLIPFLFNNEIKIEKKEIVKFALAALFSTILSFIAYASIYFLIRKDFGGSTEQFLAYSSFGLLRIIRNIWVSFINSFGSLTPFILLTLLISKVRKKYEWAAWIILVFLMSIGGAYWEGDLMMRRIVFVAVFLSLAFYKYLGKKSLYIILYLLPITAFNAALYYKNLSNMPLAVMQENIDKLPPGEVLISSHYYFPFTKYEGEILWFETDNMSQIDDLLKSGKRVFLAKESVTTPYLLIVGNNYHITSLGKSGNSDAKILFEKYRIDKYENSFEIKNPNVKEISKDAGQPIVFYGQSYYRRLDRMRINYGDMGIWIASFITGKKDSIGWTYKDVTGTWVYP